MANLAQSGNIWILVFRTSAGCVIPQKKELILPVNGDSNSIFFVYFKMELSVLNRVSALRHQERECRNISRKKMFMRYKKNL